METITTRQTTNHQDLTSLPAVELAAMIARGDISSLEVVEAHIERIERVNPRLNAVVVTRYDAARAEARKADERRSKGELLGPLHGVPITVKEALDVEGAPTTFGLPSRARVLAGQDDLYVARMREAGAIILGKTNVAQLLYFIESDNPLYGRTPDGGRYSKPLGERAIVSQVGVLARQVADVALGSAGLPVGVQVVARPWREHVALAAMHLIEAACRHSDYPRMGLL